MLLKTLETNIFILKMSYENFLLEELNFPFNIIIIKG